MSSGIYKLVFGGSLVYIGKSVDIEKRWSQHSKALQKGTHTPKIQNAYNKYGMPEFSIIFECHPDHINLLEIYFINKYWSSNILNSTKPGDLLEDEKSILQTISIDTWDQSTFEILEKWIKAVQTVNKLQKKLDELKDIDNKLTEYETKLEKCRNRKFWNRLLNRPI